MLQPVTALPNVAILLGRDPETIAHCAMAGPLQALAIPSVHMNGTGAQQLQDAARASLEAVRQAIETVAKNGPHARDYYIQPAGAFDRAAEQHRARVVILDAVAAELEALALAVLDGGFKTG